MLANRQLKMHQREHIAWERDTVWRQMIGKERRGENDGQLKAIGATLVKEDESGLLDVSTPVGRFRLTKKKISLVVAVGLFITLLNVQTVEGEEANRCFAILMFSTVMWATEVRKIPSRVELLSIFLTGNPFIRHLAARPTSDSVPSSDTGGWASR